MKKIIYSILFTLVTTTATAAATIELVSMIPTNIKGTLSYATHKYWITDSSGKVIELSVTDEAVKALDLSNKDEVELNGEILTYDNGSVYFKPRLPKRINKPQLNFNVQDSEPYDVKILIDNERVFESHAYRSAEVKKVFAVENGKLAFIQLFNGGTACPALSMIIFARYDSEPLMTPTFGTCSDIPDFSVNDNKVFITFPGNPVQHWIWDSKQIKLTQQLVEL